MSEQRQHVRTNGKKLTSTQKRVSVGDVVQWEHFSLGTGFRARGSRDSSIMAGSGTVEEAHDAHVMVREAKIPKPKKLICIPRVYITSRETASERERRQASERVAKRPRHGPASAVKRKAPSASISRPSPLRPNATKDERIAYYEQLVEYYRQNLKATQQDNREKRKSLKRGRDMVESELLHKSPTTFNSSTTQTTTPSTIDQCTQTNQGNELARPLASMSVSLKAGSRSSGAVLDSVRDLSVDLRVKHGHAAHSVFDTTRTVLTALGAQVYGLPQGQDTANRFLTERETKLAGVLAHAFEDGCGGV